MAEKHGRRPTEHSTAKQSSPHGYQIQLTSSAMSSLRQMKRLADEAVTKDDASSSHITSYRFVIDVLNRVIPANPTNPQFALHTPMADMYRIVHGRIRILWFAEKDSRDIIVMVVSNEPCQEANADVKHLTLTRLEKAGLLGTILDEYRRATSVPAGARPH